MSTTGFVYNPPHLDDTPTPIIALEADMRKSATIALLYIMCALCACERSQVQQDPTITTRGRDVPIDTSHGERAPTNPTPSTSVVVDHGDHQEKEKHAPIPALGDHNTIDQDKLVRGEHMNDVKAKYGEPASTYTFNLDDGVPEFRVELLNDYPPGSDKSKGVEIMEHTYKASEDGATRFLTIWYHEVDGQWIALQAISYSDNVEF